MTLRVPGRRPATTCLLAGGALLLLLAGAARADEANHHRSPPVPVTFGVRALTPDEPVNPRTAFVSQQVVLPAAVCTTCTDQDTWTRTWSASQATLDRDNTQADQGWYVFRSGLKGIGVSVRAGKNLRPTESGTGAQLTENGELGVGLTRLARHTGAGLADLPPAEFSRITTFRGPDGQVKYVQEDTFRVSADFRVPTCTSTTGTLHMVLPDMDRGQLRRVPAGQASDSAGSVPQLVVANCSENTRQVRVRFIPSGSVADSVAGPATILVGRDESGQDTGSGFLMRYEARGFGQVQQGVARWDGAFPVTLGHPDAPESGDELTEGVSLSLQAFWARPDNGLPLGSGQITAKGLYQVSYE